MGLVNTGIKSTPCVQWNMLLYFCFLWAYISSGGPGQTHDIMDSIKYQQIKHQQVTDSVRNLIMGHVWIFQLYNNPKTNLKNYTKWVTEHKTKLLLWPFQSSDLNPVENERVNWREEAPSWRCASEGSGEILDEGMISDLLSGVL